MEYREFSAKTKEDAITEACQYFTVSSDKLVIDVVDDGSKDFSESVQNLLLSKLQ